MSAKFSSDQIVRSLYKGALQRDPDPEGYKVCMSRLERGEPVEAIVRDMVNSPEFGRVFSDKLREMFITLGRQSMKR